MAISDKRRNAIEHFELEVNHGFRFRKEFRDCRGTRSQRKRDAIDLRKFERQTIRMQVEALRALRKTAGL